VNLSDSWNTPVALAFHANATSPLHRNHHVLARDDFLAPATLIKPKQDTQHDLVWV
jgi:hypothetical protein